MQAFIDIARSYPGRTVLMVLFMIIGVAAETAGLSALLPLLALMVGEDAADGAQSRVQEVVLDALARLGVASTLANLLLLFVLLAIVQSGLMLMAKRYVGFTATQMATDQRLALLRALADARWSYFSRQSLGSVSAAVSSEAGRASAAYVAGGTLVSLLMQAAAYSALAFAVSWQFSLVALGAALVSLYPVRFFMRLTRKAGRKQTEFMRSLVRQLAQSLQAVKPLKAMSRESTLAALLERDAERLDRASRKQVLAMEGRKGGAVSARCDLRVAGGLRCLDLWRRAVGGAGRPGSALEQHARESEQGAAAVSADGRRRECLLGPARAHRASRGRARGEEPAHVRLCSSTASSSRTSGSATATSAC